MFLCCSFQNSTKHSTSVSVYTYTIISISKESITHQSQQYSKTAAQWIGQVRSLDLVQESSFSRAGSVSNHSDDLSFSDGVRGHFAPPQLNTVDGGPTGLQLVLANTRNASRKHFSANTLCWSAQRSVPRLTPVSSQAAIFLAADSTAACKRRASSCLT